MKLLMFGHWSHSGFGTVTAELGQRFLAAGVDVRILAVNHRGEPVRGPLEGRVWPCAMFGEPFGGNLSAPAINGTLWPQLDPDDAWKPDAVLVISDVTGLLSHMGRMSSAALDVWRSVPVLHYCPIEGDNLNPVWKALWNIVRPIAMSDYGARIIGAHIGQAVPRIYHGVDTDTFRQVSITNPAIVEGHRLGTREACKAYFGLGGRKVLLRTDRNVIRKFYYRLLEAFVPIAQQDPDVDLVLHCEPDDIDGIDLRSEVLRMPEEFRERVRFTGSHDTFKGLPVEGLVALYNAADVYVSTTGGEGFGLTLAESIACETPVVSTGWAAEVEVVGPGGILLPPLTDRNGEPVRYHSKMGMDWAIPDAGAFVEPVLDLLQRPSRRRALGAEGRKHVQRSFNWDTATAEFLAILEEPDVRSIAS